MPGASELRDDIGLLCRKHDTSYEELRGGQEMSFRLKLSAAECSRMSQ